MKKIRIVLLIASVWMHCAQPSSGKRLSDEYFEQESSSLVSSESDQDDFDQGKPLVLYQLPDGSRLSAQELYEQGFEIIPTPGTVDTVLELHDGTVVVKNKMILKKLYGGPNVGGYFTRYDLDFWHLEPILTGAERILWKKPEHLVITNTNFKKKHFNL